MPEEDFSNVTVAFKNDQVTGNLVIGVKDYVYAVAQLPCNNLIEFRND